MTTTRWWSWAVAGLALSAACAGTPATAEQRALAERRLLAPFLVAREVGCGELDIELTGNFHANVGQPALDQQRHTVVNQRGDGYVETVWTNVSGAADSAFGITVGEPPELTDRGWVAGEQTRFRVVNRLRVRIWEDRRDLTLTATASGAFVFVQDSGAKPREVARWQIADGAVRQP
ncbi:MAG: hypothetical protein WAT39_00985 [Planctomycetota bacterium]